MEKMTRMSKYKELRESLKNDVVTTEETHNYVVNEEIVKDASYYRNIVGDNKVELQQAHAEDTLHESLTFETITENEPEEIKTAIERVRENSGVDQFNTRMDILNKIRQSKVEVTETNVEEIETEDEVKSLKEEIEAKVQQSVNESMFEEIEEETETEEEQRKKRFGFFKKKESNVEEEIVEEIQEEVEEEEEEEEESSFMVKLLNGCIIILSLVLLGLVIFIAKEFIL